MRRDTIKSKKPKSEFILYVPKIHFIIYLATLISGLISSIAIVWVGIYFNNSIINYFLSFTASLVITPFFAYMIDVANSKIHKKILTEKRQLFLNPLIGNILALLGRTSIIWNYDDFRDKEIAFSNIEDFIDALLNKYVICISNLSQQNRDIRLVNESFNIKHWEEYGFREIEKQLKQLLDNQMNLINESIFTSKDYFYFNLLYSAVEKARLPYLTVEQDKNISKTVVDWPQMPLSEIDINNLHSSFKFFISTLKNVIANLDDFKHIAEFNMKPHKL